MSDAVALCLSVRLVLPGSSVMLTAEGCPNAAVMRARRLQCAMLQALPPPPPMRNVTSDLLHDAGDVHCLPTQGYLSISLSNLTLKGMVRGQTLSWDRVGCDVRKQIGQFGPSHTRLPIRIVA